MRRLATAYRRRKTCHGEGTIHGLASSGRWRAPELRWLCMRHGGDCSLRCIPQPLSSLQELFFLQTSPVGVPFMVLTAEAAAR